jgi:murein L,D-transpeptidase YafK
MKLKHLIILFCILCIGGLGIYYFYPIQKIPDDITIDRILVLKSKHALLAFSKSELIVTYTIAIGKTSIGAKEFEGDLKTPEGIYTINSKNPNSGYHKNLGVSYPNIVDIQNAKKLGKPTGGDIKIHGLKNGQGYTGKFHRLKDWTNGCIALTDQELDEIYNHTPVGTTIEILK